MIMDKSLKGWKELEYEIDGIIVANDEIYERTEKNPKHAFAFKMVLSDQVAEAKVLDVIWTPSKDGYLKPRIRIEPIFIGGAEIRYATAFNGAFVRDNKIGIGAVILTLEVYRRPSNIIWGVLLAWNVLGLFDLIGAIVLTFRKRAGLKKSISPFSKGI